MISGYAGKILRINLSSQSAGIIDTEQYEEYGGGHGIGSAIFWDTCQEKAISGFDPRNVITIIPGPLAGTLTPGGGRMEICGINVFSYPIEWFGRSSIGGFFGTMLKHAGWDGIVIEGKSNHPVWINILNDKVTLENANDLWGLDSFATQDEIWRRVTGRDNFGEWISLGETRTTQGPAILCIGQGGESLSRMGTIQSGCSMSASQSGFGAVWGAKNLKAISVIGTGSIKVADINSLLMDRKWLQNIIGEEISPKPFGRQTSCAGCFQKCKGRSQTGTLNDAQCLGSILSVFGFETLGEGRSSADIIEMYGLNMNDLTNASFTDGVYINKLYKGGILGPGKTIDSSPLPMEKFGTAEFTEALCQAIISRKGIGSDLAEGLMRAAAKWGRLEKDLSSGILHRAQWGYGWHWSLPFVEQGYGSLMGERDICEHGFSINRLWNDVRKVGATNLPAEKIVEIMTEKMVPYNNDPLMFDYSWQENDGSNMRHALATGIYSEHKAKLVAWHRHYTRFWIESVIYCDWLWPVYFSPKTADFRGFSPDYESRFLKAVTGKNRTFDKGMETGRKIWNLDRAIWVLQGRHRDVEKFAEFMYTPEGSLEQHLTVFPNKDRPPLTVYKNGRWTLDDVGQMYLDKRGVEEWKTNFYRIEGWDPTTGWPTRKTLEELGLGKVADTLEKASRLGNKEQSRN